MIYFYLPTKNTFRLYTYASTPETSVLYIKTYMHHYISYLHEHHLHEHPC